MSIQYFTEEQPVFHGRTTIFTHKNNFKTSCILNPIAHPHTNVQDFHTQNMSRTSKIFIRKTCPERQDFHTKLLAWRDFRRRHLPSLPDV